MDLDLLDLDMFKRGEQDEVFARLRREAPVSWQDHPGGRGFWSVVKHLDVVTVNRDAALFSSELGSISPTPTVTLPTVSRYIHGTHPSNSFNLVSDCSR